MGNNKAYPKEMWWHHHPVFVVNDGGLSEAREGQKHEYETDWKYRDRAAWCYELVRSLGMVDPAKLPRGQPVPSSEILKNLTSLPQYDQLDVDGLASITASLNFHIGFRPLVVHPAELPGVAASTYSSLPHLALDLTADDAPLIAWFVRELNTLRKQRGLERVRKASHASKNKDKPDYRARWDFLDFIRDPEKFDCVDSNKSRCRSDVLKEAIANVEAVAKGVLHCALRRIPGNTRDLRFGFSGRELPKVFKYSVDSSKKKLHFPMAWLLSESRKMGTSEHKRLVQAIKCAHKPV